MNERYVRQLTVGAQTIAVSIVRRRRKTMAIHVFPDRPVELRVPLKCPWSAIDAFLAERSQWIADAIDTLTGDTLPEPLQYVHGEIHDYLGKSLRLSVSEGRTRHVSAADDVLAVRCRSPDDPEDVRRALEAFYSTEARRMFPDRLTICLSRFHKAPGAHTLTIRKMRAKWGSCSSEGEICLNSLLMQKPMEAIDFVVTHELCHLRHFAHNKSFYRLMDQTMPDWREREKLLTRRDARLQLDLF